MQHPQPQALRHLTQDDINEAAAVAYSENVRGTVQDYEAVISAILNRVRSGDRQFVDDGQQFTVRNVTHSKAHGDQFQGVHDDPKDPLYDKGRNYREFGSNHGQAAENARIAAENIAAHGPTHNRTFFIALEEGQRPTERERRNLGHNMQRVGQMGNVYLYAPAPPARRHQVARHQHDRPAGPHPHTPQHRR